MRNLGFSTPRGPCSRPSRARPRALGQPARSRSCRSRGRSGDPRRRPSARRWSTPRIAISGKDRASALGCCVTVNAPSTGRIAPHHVSRPPRRRRTRTPRRRPAAQVGGRAARRSRSARRRRRSRERRRSPSLRPGRARPRATWPIVQEGAAAPRATRRARRTAAADEIRTIRSSLLAGTRPALRKGLSEPGDRRVPLGLRDVEGRLLGMLAATGDRRVERARAPRASADRLARGAGDAADR